MTIIAASKNQNFKNIDKSLLNLEEETEFFENKIKTDVSFIPVILGNSLNAQSYAREFFDKYNVKSIVITNDILWTIKHSIYVEVHEEYENILQNLIKIENHVDPGTKLLIISTNDAGVESLINLKESGLMLNNWHVYYPSSEIFNNLTKKGEFARIASELGIPHPLTIEFDLAGDESPDLSSIILEGPIWVKPSHRPEWNEAEVENQKKAYRVENVEEAEKILQNIAESNFEGNCIIQEEIPGDDDLLVSIDVYCDNGKAKIISVGRKLMEQKGRMTIGNALSILSGNVPQQGIDDAVRLLEHVEWNGWANIDGKIDPRSGQVIFFEVNPRLGRSHYYITASGYNAVTPYVEKMFDQEVEPAILEDNILFTSVPFDVVYSQLTDAEIIVKVNNIGLEDIYNPLMSNDDSSYERLSIIQEAIDNQWWLN